MTVYFSETALFKDGFFEKARFVPLSKREKFFDVKNQSLCRESILAWSLFSFGYRRLGHGDGREADIKHGSHGKPFISEKNVFFNISHSDGVCLCAFSGSEIGADIQRLSSPKSAVLERVCSRDEADIIKSADSPEKLFTKCWTLKEAYLKHSGEGIAGGLSSADFSSVLTQEHFYKDNLYFVSKSEDEFCFSVCSREKEVNFERILPDDFNNLFV